MSTEEIMQLVNAYGIACINHAIATRNHELTRHVADATEAHVSAERAGEARRAIERAITACADGVAYTTTQEVKA